MLKKIKHWLTNPKLDQIWISDISEVVVVEVGHGFVIVWNTSVYNYFRYSKEFFKKNFRRIK